MLLSCFLFPPALSYYLVCFCLAGLDQNGASFERGCAGRDATADRPYTHAPVAAVLAGLHWSHYHHCAPILDQGVSTCGPFLFQCLVVVPTTTPYALFTDVCISGQVETAAEKKAADESAAERLSRIKQKRTSFLSHHHQRRKQQQQAKRLQLQKLQQQQQGGKSDRGNRSGGNGSSDASDSKRAEGSASGADGSEIDGGGVSISQMKKMLSQMDASSISTTVLIIALVIGLFLFLRD